MLLAFDNTDGPKGGCTTHLAFHVLLALPELALTGMPRLVRLNPNVPWKTRGNGAVVLPLGAPQGPQVRVGELRGNEILAFPDAAPVAPDESILERVWAVLTMQAQPDALPGLMLTADPPPEPSYWETVRTFVSPESAKKAAEDLGVLHREAGDGRGLIGCLGAAAWTGPPSSYEFVAYREPARYGKERSVDPRPLMGLDSTGATFHTYDAEALRLCCVPHTPDPVLIGLRGRDPERLRETALRVLPSALKEPVDGWLLWATNHGSGDHVTPIDGLADAPAMASVAVAGTVTAAPVTRHGGHVVVTARDGTGSPFEAVAFEPTKSFRDRVRALGPGDRVRFVGALSPAAPAADSAADSPGTGLVRGASSVRLEKMEVLALAPRQRLENPLCVCGRRMRSKGPSTGYKCPACGAYRPRDAGVLVQEAPLLAPGWHEVPTIARRHLHRPVAWG